MKILTAFDSFKGSLGSAQANRAFADGFRQVIPDAEIMELPMADGGEGTAKILVAAKCGQWRECSVTGPLGECTTAGYGIVDGDVAVMDVASAIGLTLVPVNKRNPMIANSAGVGDLIRKAVEAGCRKVIVGLGGSATCDGGMGMLEALGVKFYGEDGLLHPCGANMVNIVSVDVSNLTWLKEVEIWAMYDVDCALYGRNGAACVFAPQKGATPEMVEILDQGLRNIANVAGRRTVISGEGAAGGMGFAFAAFLGARLCPGAEIVIAEAGMDKAFAEADYVITGEGSIDRQTLMGKVPFAVLNKAHAYGKPVIAICGRVRDSEMLEQAGFAALFSIVGGPVSESEAMDSAEATENIRRTARQIAGLLKS